MFKKILLSLASIAVLVFTAVPAVHAIETQFVYVGDLNISETEYQAGDEITGSFTLRNAGEKDVGQVTYNVLLTQIDTANGNFDVKSYSVLVEKKGEPFDIAARTKTDPVNFSIAIPASAKGDAFELKVEILSVTGGVISWMDSQRFSILNNDKRAGSLTAENASISLGESGATFGLQSGPMIYAEKEPMKAAFIATLKNSGEKTVVESRVVVSGRPFNESAAVRSEKVITTIDSNGSAELSIPLPTFEYVPGVYEGRAYFTVDAEEMIAPISFRYLVGGESAAIHSLSSSKSQVAQGEEFNVVASITGTPFDITDSPDTQETIEPQIVNLNLTIQNERGIVVAEDVILGVDLHKTSDVEFSLTSSKKSQALKGILTIQNRDGKLLAQLESNLSADYGQKAGKRSKNFFLLILSALVLAIMTFVIVRLRNKIPPVSKQTAAVIVAIIVSSTLIGLSLVYSQKTFAGSPLPAYTYNTDPARQGLVYGELFSYYHGRTYEGVNTTTSQEHFVNNGWGPRFTLNFPIDAEYEVGESFPVSARVTYATCGNTALTLDVGAVSSGTSAPTDAELGLDIIATEATALTKTALRDMFIAEYRTTVESDGSFSPSLITGNGCSFRTCRFASEAARQTAIQNEINSKLATFDSTVARYVSGGKIRNDSYPAYAETLSFGTPVVSIDNPSRIGYNYDFSKTLSAPMTPGMHKLWIGSVVGNHKNYVTVCSRRDNPKYGCRDFGYVDIEGVPIWGQMIGGYISENYQRIKGYQTYKVLPPSPESISFDTESQCGKVVVSWTQKSVYQAGQVDTYKLYRKTTSDSDYVLVSSSIAGSATSYTDTPPAGTTGPVSYKLIARHNASGFDSDPKEGTTGALTGESCENMDGLCGSKDGRYVGAGYTFSSADMCAAGASSTGNPIADASGNYAWTCAGTGTGSSDSCTATANENQVPICGPAAHPATLSSWPASDIGLCTTGGVENKYYSSSNGSYNWACVLAPLDIDCYAIKPAVIADPPSIINSAGSCSPAEVPDVNTISLDFESTTGTTPITFEIWRSTSSSGTYAKIGESSAYTYEGKYRGSYNDATVVPGMTYYYKIKARNSAGTTDFGPISDENTPAVCQSIGVCGPSGDDEEDFMYTSPQNIDGLCSLGTVTGISTDDVNQKYTWICDGLDGDDTCSAKKAPSYTAECGTAEGKEYSTVPLSTWSNLCKSGFSNEPKIDPSNNTKYTWTCTSLDRTVSDVCQASMPEWVDPDTCATNPTLCPEDYPACGVKQTFYSPPNEFTSGLCKDGLASNVKLVTDGTGYEWDCSVNTRKTSCNGELGITTPPPTCPDGTPLPCEVDEGSVVLNDLKTWPRLINRGGACSVFVGKTQGLFNTANEFTRCRVYTPNGNLAEHINYLTLPDEKTVQQNNIFAESSFKVSCYQVDIDPVTGAEVVPPQAQWVEETGSCKINPAHVETSFLDRMFGGVKSMSASAFDAFAHFFNLK